MNANKGDTEKVEYPSIATVQNDIASANQYRLELLKTLIVLAGGLFAFAISTTSGERGQALQALTCDQGLGWTIYANVTGAAAQTCQAWARASVLTSGLSIFLGLAQLRLWAAFYLSYRGKDWTEGRGAGKGVRNVIGVIRLVTMIALVIAFVSSIYMLWIVYLSGA